MNGSYVIHLTFDGLHRDYRIHVPPQAASGQPLPMVINMAGATQNGQIEEILSDMDPNADANGYLAVYPDGTRISKVLTPDPVAKQAQYGWNAGECCGLPVTKKINDVGFLEKVIADVAARTPVDLRRVYMTGISNGGMMAYAFAAEASTHVAAIASVSGQVEIPVIHPTRPVPTMEFHSVNDPIAKFAGVPNKNPLLVLSVMQGIHQWVKADGCCPHAPRRHRDRRRERFDLGRRDGHADHLWTLQGRGGRGAVALHRLGARVARQPAQHGAQEELDPDRLGSGDHHRQRGRDDVEVLFPLRVAGKGCARRLSAPLSDAIIPRVCSADPQHSCTIFGSARHVAWKGSERMMCGQTMQVVTPLIRPRAVSLVFLTAGAFGARNL